jgi:hypothetical protein
LAWLISAEAQLRDGARRRLDVLRPERLHRVDHNQSGGRRACERGNDIGEIGLGAESDVRLLETQAFGAHAHLGSRLLAREVDHAGASSGELGGSFKQKRRLADARVAADQHGGARHEPTAEHAVELWDTGRQARCVRCRFEKALEGGESARASSLAAFDGHEGRGAGRGCLLDDRIPLAARGAFARPAGSHRAAGLADEGSRDLGHRRTSRRYSAGRRGRRDWSAPRSRWCRRDGQRSAR